MANYNGSIELISGITPKNNGDFALVNAKDVQVDETGMRLDEKLLNLEEVSNLSDEVKAEIVQQALDSETIKSMKTSVETLQTTSNNLSKEVFGDEANPEEFPGIAAKLQEVNEDIEELQLDPEKRPYQLAFGETNKTTLYLFKDELNATPEDENGLAKDNVISSVVVTGGSGVGAVDYTLKVNRVTPAEAICLFGDEANIKYSFINAIYDDKQITDIGGSVTAKWYVNNSLVSSERVTQSTEINAEGTGVNNPVILSFNVGPYLTSGASNTATLYLVNDEGTQKKMVWTVNAVDMYNASEFNDANEQSGDINFIYTPYGNIEKTVHFELDNVEIGTYNTSQTGIPRTFVITQKFLTHGSHLFKIYSEATIENIDAYIGDLDKLDSETRSFRSKDLLFDIIYTVESKKDTIIGCIYSTMEAVQYSTIKIPYVVYTPGSATSVVDLLVDGEVVSTLTVNREKQYWNYKPTEKGGQTLYIRSNGVVKTIILTVTEFEYSIEPVTAGLGLDFNPIGRSNAEEKYNEYTFNGKQYMAVSDNFDWTNGGWKVDENGESCFCVKAGTTMTLDYPLFGIGDTTTSTGKDFKLTYKATACKTFDARVMSCFATLDSGSVTSGGGDSTNAEGETETEIETSSGVGIIVNAQKAYLSSSARTLDLTYAEDTKVSLEFNITPKTKYYEMLGLIDADYSRVKIYTDSDLFDQSMVNAQVKANGGYVPLTFGSENCDVYIYRFKAYTTYLSDKNILDNHIADMTDTDEMIECYKRNDILNDDGLTINPQKLALANPDLRVIEITCDHAPIDKTGVENCSITQTYVNGRPEDNWTIEGVTVKGQGTSSMQYKISALNLDIDCSTSERGFVWTGGSAPKYAMSENDIAEDYFNIKVNVASSENANNALFQDEYHLFQPYLRNARKEYLMPTGEKTTEGEDILENVAHKVRDTMHFYPCVIFIKETNADNLKGRTYFADDRMNFYACGDFGNSKKNANATGMVPTNRKECIVEICNNDDLLCRFKTNDTRNEKWDKYNKENGTGEALEFRYDNADKATDPNRLWIRAAAQRLFGWVNSTDTTEITNKEIKDVITPLYEMIQSISEDYFNEVYGGKQISELVAEDVARYTGWGYTRDTAAFRREKFLKELENYFIKDSLTYHYLFTERHTMIDNRAKNTFIHTEDGIIWNYVFDYDNDTADGNDNSGYLTYDFGVEDTDNIEGTIQPAFNASDSVLWCNVRDFLSADLEAMFKDREGALANDGSGYGAWNATRILSKFNQYQSTRPERLVMTDMRRKYLRPYEGLQDGYVLSEYYGTTDDFLPRMLGQKKSQRQYFEIYQEKYMSSKYGGSVASADGIEMRITARTPSYIEITPFAKMYLNVKVGAGSFNKHIKAAKGEKIRIDIPAVTGDTEASIYSASLLSKLEGLSTLYLHTLNIGSAKKIQTLDVGSGETGYSNTRLESLSFGSNELLESVNVMNCPGLTELKDIDKCISLKELYTEGSGVTTLKIADGGLLTTAHLNDIGSLTLKNLLNLNDLTFTSTKNLFDLTIEFCPLIDTLQITRNAPSLNILRLLGINWPYLENTDILNKFKILNGRNNEGEPTNQSVLEGYVKVPQIRESEKLEYESIWPRLEVDYTNTIQQHPVTFVNYDGTVLKTVLVDHGTTCADPGLEPKKPSDIQYQYTFSGWDIDLKTTVITTDTTVVTAQFTQTLQTYTVKWIGYSGAVLQTSTVEYGSDAVYTEPVPTRAPSGATYYLFDGWDMNTTFVERDLTVRPKWAEGALPVVGTPVEEMTPVEIFSIVNMGLVGEYFKISSDAPIPEIDVQLGYMPDYDNVTSDVLISEPFKLNGSNYYDTNLRLFENDISFTLAVDYTLNYTTVNGPHTLFSCYNEFDAVVNGISLSKYGFRLSAATSSGGVMAAPAFRWGGAAEDYIPMKERIPTTDKGCHDICVVKHIKGDPNIYIYTNDRYTANPVVKKAILGSVINSIPNTLVFGAEKTAEDVIKNYAFGQINYSKLWYGELSDAECEKICAWTYDKMTFQYVGENRYTITNSTKSSKASFIAKNLLEEPMQFKTQHSLGGWSTSDLRTWMNLKLFAGFSPIWQQMLQNCIVPSLNGFIDTTNSANKEKVVTSNDYLYIPSIGEVDSSIVGASPWNKELNESNNTNYPTFTTNQTRLKYYGENPNTDKDGDGVQDYGVTWWTRTPSQLDSYPRGNLVVTTDGQATTVPYGTFAPSATMEFFNPAQYYGVCPCFSL